ETIKWTSMIVAMAQHALGEQSNSWAPVALAFYVDLLSWALVLDIFFNHVYFGMYITKSTLKVTTFILLIAAYKCDNLQVLLMSGMSKGAFHRGTNGHITTQMGGGEWGIGYEKGNEEGTHD
ncbi:hypothetical protein ACJX0J_030141, partial [Zea mays]